MEPNIYVFVQALTYQTMPHKKNKNKNHSKNEIKTLKMFRYIKIIIKFQVPLNMGALCE